MTKHHIFKQVAITIVALVSIGAVVPATTASAKTRTTPTELRGIWIRSIGDAGYTQYHINKGTFWYSYGGIYHLGKWDRDGAKTLKLGSKVKKNKMFTISKKDKKGYRILRASTNEDSQLRLKIKKVKVNKKVRMRITQQFSQSNETHNYFEATKHWEAKNNWNF